MKDRKRNKGVNNKGDLQFFERFLKATVPKCFLKLVL